MTAGGCVLESLPSFRAKLSAHVGTVAPAVLAAQFIQPRIPRPIAPRSA
jgi:hypothetical protein